jgi:hypothetical protein
MSATVQQPDDLIQENQHIIFDSIHGELKHAVDIDGSQVLHIICESKE